MASGKRKTELVTPDSYANRGDDDDDVPISLWLKKKKAKEEERKLKWKRERKVRKRSERVKPINQNTALFESPCLSSVEHDASPKVMTWSSLESSDDDAIALSQGRIRKGKETVKAGALFESPCLSSIEHDVTLYDSSMRGIASPSLLKSFESPWAPNVEESKPDIPTSPTYPIYINVEENREFYENFDPRTVSECDDPCLMHPDDEDICAEISLRPVDVDHCDSDGTVDYPYSSEGETIPSDDEDEWGIPSLKPRKLNFADKSPACSSNEEASGVNSEEKDAKVEWVVSNIKTYMDTYNRTKASTIRKIIFRVKKGKVKVAYRTARRARVRLLEDMHGSYEESFRLLSQLCRQIEASNPESIVTLNRQPHTKQFEGLCIAYKASLDGFKYGCRPIIGLESSPLQGKYGGSVLSATSLDADNGMFPVAIYICRRACYDTWNKFLSIIAPFLKGLQRRITFFPRFDRHSKGCHFAVTMHFKDHRKRFCLNQLEIELSHQFFSHHFSHYHRICDAAMAYNEQEFKAIMDELEAIDPVIVQWMRLHEKGWARHQFDTSANCSHMSNILGVAFNQWIKELRCLPIYEWVIKYERQLLDLFSKRLSRYGGMGGNECERFYLVQRPWYKLWKQGTKITGYEVTPTLNNNLWCVHNEKLKSTSEVDLAQRLCKCGEWQITGIPCVHAMAVLVKERPNDLDSYVDECFTLGRYGASYAGSIKPAPKKTYEPRHWQEQGTLPPPLKNPRRKSSHISRPVPRLIRRLLY